VLEPSRLLQETVGFLKMPMITRFSYHSRSFLKTEFDETAEMQNIISALTGDERK
jgi:hypothetical protein